MSVNSNFSRTCIFQTGFFYKIKQIRFDLVRRCHCNNIIMIFFEILCSYQGVSFNFVISTTLCSWKTIIFSNDNNSSLVFFCLQNTSFPNRKLSNQKSRGGFDRSFLATSTTHLSLALPTSSQKLLSGPKTCSRVFLQSNFFRRFETFREYPGYLGQGIQKFVEDSLLKIWSDMICLGKHFFKGCLPQLLLGPFLNTLTYLSWLLNLIERESPIIFYILPF